MYWKSIGSALGIAILISLFLMQLSRNTTDLWLSYWVTSISQNNNVTNVSYIDNGIQKILLPFIIFYYLFF